MVNRFTERARRVVVLATEEARSRRHEAVGPDHLLMSILRDGSSSTVHMLEQLRNPETLRTEVERVLSEIPGSATGGDPTFSVEFKAVLEVALSGKRRLTVSTDLLLLALAEGHSQISAILRASGADDRRLMLMSGFRKPVTEEEVSFVATSRWRVPL